MQYIKSISVALVFVLSWVCFGFGWEYALVSADTAEIIAEDTFNNYRVGDLPEGYDFLEQNKDNDNYGEISTDPDDQTNKVLLVKTDTQSSEYANFAFRKFQNIGGNIQISYRIWYSEKQFGIMFLGQITGVLQQMTYNNQYVYKLPNNVNYGVPNVSLKCEQWHDVVLDLRFEDKTYDIIFDGEYYAQNFPFIDSELEYINQIEFGTAWDRLYLDDLKITNDGAIVTNYRKITSEAYSVNSSQGKIYNVGFETEQAAFINNINFVEGAVCRLYQKDGVTPDTNRFVTNSTTLKVTSPDNTQEKLYTLVVRSWAASIHSAHYAAKAAVFRVNSADAIVDGKKRYINSLNSDVVVFKEGERIYLPVRCIAEGLGYDLSYDSTNNTVAIGDIELDIDSGKMYDGGQLMSLSGECMLSGEVLFVPFEWVEIIFGIEPEIHDFDLVTVGGYAGFSDYRIKKLVLTELQERL